MRKPLAAFAIAARNCSADPKVLRQLRGNRIAMIFQEPMTSLNPLHTIEKQIGESAGAQGLGGKAAQQRTLELLELVGIQKPKSASRPIRISCPAASANG
jgi:ABC-type microcin C transport system duplicated ATPase subunit YejF